MSPPSVPVGAVIAGKYRVEKVLGAGAMGVVVAARHLDLHELRAIKLMIPTGQESPEGVERFLREARAAARLRSQHVAKVHDVGRLDDGAPYAVIEYLEGSDLKAVLDARGTLSPEEAITYLLQVCEAIGEAHAAGIVHRDLKPANLFLTTGASGAPCVKVLDFGIAKMATDAGAAVEMTATSQMLGTPLYMSPEQMRGARDVDGRADIWAIGVILYRMLTGRTPFSGSSVTEICSAVIADTPAPPRSLRPDLPLVMEHVILRCLQKNPADRYASAADLATALERARSAIAGGAAARTQGSIGTATTQVGPAPAAASATMGPGAHPPHAPAASATMGPGAHPPHVAATSAAMGAGAHPPHVAAAGAAMSAGPGWGAPSSLVYNAPPSMSAPARKSSRLGLFLGIGAGTVMILGSFAIVFFLFSGDGDEPLSSHAAQEPGRSAPPAASPTSTGAATAPGPSAGARPSGRGGAPAFGQGASGQGSPAASPQPSSPAAPASATAPASAPAPAGASAKSIGMLQGVMLSCWKNNEGASPGEPASSATVQVTVIPSRSVLVSGPAKAKKNFTACVVSKAASTAFDPGDAVVTASAGLPAGPS